MCKKIQIPKLGVELEIFYQLKSKNAYLFV